MDVAHERSQSESGEIMLTRSCSECSWANAESANFCSGCGIHLIRASVSVCSSCGSELRPNAKYCSQCGVNNVPDVSPETQR